MACPEHRMLMPQLPHLAQAPKKQLQGLQKQAGKAVDKAAPAAAKALPKGVPAPGLPKAAEQAAAKAVQAVKSAAPAAPKLPAGVPTPGLPKVRA